MKKITLVSIFVLGLLGITQVAQAQTTINSTSLSAAITDTNATNIIGLTSIGAGATAVVAGNLIYVDGEVMRVKATPTAAASVSVQRHYMSSPGATHLSGAFVYYGPSQAFVTGKIGAQFFVGSCTTANQLYLPVIDVVNALIGDCPSDGVWVWFQLNAPAMEMRIRHAVVNTAYTAKITDYIIAFTSLSATRAVTLPAASGLAGKMYIIKDEGGFATTGKVISIVGTVDGSGNPNAVVAPYGVYRIYSDGSNWFTW